MSKSESTKLLRRVHDAISDAIESWEFPDSPEAFCYSMKELSILRDRIAAILNIKK